MRILWFYTMLSAVAAIARFGLASAGYSSDLHGQLSDLLWAVPVTLLATWRGLWLAAPLLLVWTAIYMGDWLFFVAMGASFNHRDLHYLLDSAFLQATLGSLWLLKLVLLAGAALLVCVLLWGFARITRPSAGGLGRFVVILLASLAAVLHYQSLRPNDWSNSSLVALHGNALLTDLFSEPSYTELPAIVDDTLPPAGNRLLNTGEARNVLLIVIEGLTGIYLPQVAALNGEQPDITLHVSARWAERSWLVPNFITHARQTSRGMYAMLCGDFPKLLGGNPKPMELLGDEWAARQCLPHLLSARGYRTAYYQAADLGFMSKDRVMPFIGFQQVRGRESFPPEGAPSATGTEWGASDRTFFQQVLPRLEALNSEGQPWFATLLTVGTHYPYHVSAADIERYGSPKLASVALADQALDFLLRELESRDILDDTLVVVTSDESHGVPEHWLGQNWGLFFALAPDLPATRTTSHYAGLDTANSILDYLGFYPELRTLRGRSVFRAYPRGRDLLFAGMTLKMLDANGFIHSCTSQAARGKGDLTRECVTVSSPSRRLFDRDYQPVHGDFAECYQSLWRLYAASEYRFREQKDWQLLIEGTSVPLRHGRIQAVATDQIVDIAAQSLLSIDLTLGFEGSTGSTVKVDFSAVDASGGESLIPRLELPLLQVNDKVQVSYSTPIIQDRRRAKFMLRASIEGGGQDSSTLRLMDYRYATHSPEGGRVYAPEVRLHAERQVLIQTRWNLQIDADGIASLRPQPDDEVPDVRFAEAADISPNSASGRELLGVAGLRDCTARLFSEREERVIRAYLVYYQRPADQGGLAYWSGRLAVNEVSQGDIIQAFSASDEFLERYGNLSTEALVTGIYQQLFDREPDADRLVRYADQLKAGRLSRKDVAMKMIADVAGRDRQVFENRLQLSQAKVAMTGVTDAVGQDQQVFENRMQVSRLYTTVAEFYPMHDPSAAVLGALLRDVSADVSSVERACARIAALFVELDGGPFQLPR